MSSIENLEPRLLWKHFSNICSIPHPSKHETLVVNYIHDFAKSQGLQFKTDSTGNVIVTKKATNGRENRPGVILQSHMDMVPQKNDGTIHDFIRDPIIPYIDGEWVKARGTTLGADNGIGVATMLAVLESTKLEHGPIEALFTIDEETGMTGALGLTAGMLTGTKLLNLDTEEEGQLYIGCAGGIDCSASIVHTEENTDKSSIALSVSLRGLKGGHSGIDIHLGRGNAIKLLNRILFKGSSLFDLRISSFTGGSVRNAIPREAFATIVIPAAHLKAFELFVNDQQSILNSELTGADNNVTIECTDASIPQKVLTLQSQNLLLRAVYACPNGVIRMSSTVADVVETSSNLAILDCKNGCSQIHCLLRSSVLSARQDLENAISSALSLAGANVEFSGGYPGWQPDPESGLLKLMKRVYQETTGILPQIKVVHAGLECGIIGSKYPGMEMISCGPTIQYPHSPDERVEIKSVGHFWKFLLKVLEAI